MMQEAVRTPEEFHRARSLVLRFGWNTIAYQILNPGLRLWFSPSSDSVIGYVPTRTHHIAAGAPVGSEDDLTRSVVEFTRQAAAENKRVCFFGAQQRIASILAQLSPTSSILLGAQPIWAPAVWLDRAYAKASLRAQFARAQRKGLRVELWKSDIAGGHPGLYRCLDEWLATKHLPPMHFLVEPYTLGNLEDRIVAVALREGAIEGYCIASPIPLRRGWLIEQIIRRKEAPNGTAELLLVRLIDHLHAAGSNLITLGLSPLSRHIAPKQDHPLWLSAALSLTRLYGRYFYNFDGLDSFKAKFHPEEWEPVYAITNESVPTPSTLYAIATAFSGMSPVRFVLRGLVKSLSRGSNK